MEVQYTTMDPEQSRIEWCIEANERGEICAVIERTSKASRRNRRFDCPVCRKKPPRGGDQSGEGTGGGSSAAVGGTTVRVGA